MDNYFKKFPKDHFVQKENYFGLCAYAGKNI